MQRRQARIEALERVVALLMVELYDGDGSDLGAALAVLVPDPADRERVRREVGRTIDGMVAQRDRLRGRALAAGAESRGTGRPGPAERGGR